MGIIKWFAFAGVLVIIDQLTKFLVLGFLGVGESVEINSFFSLTHVHNYGAGFSLLASEDGWQQYFLVGVSAIASLGIIFWMSVTDKAKVLMLASLGLILSGAIGNLIDRVAYGFVIDFVDLHYGEFYWPIFNVADIAIVMGVVLLMVAELKDNK